MCRACDLLLALALIGVVVARGARAVVGWGWLTAGLLVFVVSDIAFAVSDMDLTSVLGRPMQLGRSARTEPSGEVGREPRDELP